MSEKFWDIKDSEPLTTPPNHNTIPEDAMVPCKKCETEVSRRQLVESWWICPNCGAYSRMPARDWHKMLFDEGSVEEFDTGLYATNPLNFFDSKDYNDRLKESQSKTGNDDACINARGTIGGNGAVCSALDFFFMGGSMGSVVGEKVTRGAERALAERIPFITISCSGGARMQEGMYSLMQLVKTSYACGCLRQEGIPFISILADPSTAGVMASFASLGDIIIAEEGALIGFAGPRVIAQTIGGELPKGFQRPEFCLEHGQIDKVLHRHQIRPVLGRLIAMFADSAVINQQREPRRK